MTGSEGLSPVQLSEASVVGGPIALVWDQLSRFSEIGAWIAPLANGLAAQSRLHWGLDGQIGCMRVISIGGRSFVEQLTALDAEKHILRYKLISHPEAQNPFASSFLDLHSCVRLRRVTLPCEATFVEWNARFLTRWDAVDAMTQELQSWMHACLLGLEQRCVQLGAGSLGSQKQRASLDGLCRHEPGWTSSQEEALSEGSTPLAGHTRRAAFWEPSASLHTQKSLSEELSSVPEPGRSSGTFRRPMRPPPTPPASRAPPAVNPAAPSPSTAGPVGPPPVPPAVLAGFASGYKSTATSNGHLSGGPAPTVPASGRQPAVKAKAPKPAAPVAFNASWSPFGQPSQQLSDELSGD